MWLSTLVNVDSKRTLHSLSEVEDFRKTEARRDRAWPLEDADSGVAESPRAGRSGRECRQVEVVRA